MADGIFGDGSTASAAQAANALAQQNGQQAASYWDQLTAPNITYTPYQGQNVVGQLTPQNYTPTIGSVTQMQDDPANAAAQTQALKQLQLYGNGNLTPSDLAAMRQIGTAQANSGTQAYNAALGNLKTQGLAGSGADLAARLSANQQASNNASSLYNNTLANVGNRAVAANSAAGNLASTARGQSANISNAMANINNNFNTQVQQLQTDAAKSAATNANNAQQFNLTNAQNVANTNTGIANSNLDRQNTVNQQNFSNDQSIVAGKSNALNSVAAQNSAQAAALGKQNLGQQAQTMTDINGAANIANMAGLFD